MAKIAVCAAATTTFREILFHLAQEVEISITRLDECIGRQSKLCWINRFRQTWRNQDHEFRLTLDEALAAEQVAQYRYVAKSGELVDGLTQILIDQPGNADSLAIAQLVGCFSTASGQRRNNEYTTLDIVVLARRARDNNAVVLDQFTDADVDLKIDDTVTQYDGQEFQSYTKVLELDGGAAKLLFLL